MMICSCVCFRCVCCPPELHACLFLFVCVFPAVVGCCLKSHAGCLSRIDFARQFKKHVGHGGDGMVTVSGDGVECDTSLCVHVREGHVFDSQSCVREGDM